MADEGCRGPLTYRSAGVDRAAAEAAKQRIGELVRSTYSEEVVGDIGSFGGGFRLPAGEPGRVLVASADGVGTKLKVAVLAGVHDTVGYDLVAHCANDILTQGALPLFFLDYLALGRMDATVVESVLDGIARGCREIGAALIGGETAEMPDLYRAGEYDLAGFIVGLTVGDSPIDGAAIRVGDCLLGLASDGLHTNGFSLARKVLLEHRQLSLDDRIEAWGCTVGEELLRCHRCYVGPLRGSLARGELNGLAHITGGGLAGNVPRMLPAGCGALIDRGAWTVPPVFRTLQEMGGVPTEEMWETFNMGIGMVLAVHRERVSLLLEELEAAGESVHTIGAVIEGEGVSFA
ncbi:MAG: phosphoribosylformylglycinamidine cyclo-ligase [Acidobacteriota bacterium]